MHAEKTPGRSSRFEALHLALSSSNHLVRVLGPIVLDVERALTQAPNSVPGLLERGNIRRLKGDLEGARQDWEHIGRLAPGSKADLAARANLEHLETGQGVPSRWVTTRRMGEDAQRGRSLQRRDRRLESLSRRSRNQTG